MKKFLQEVLNSKETELDELLAVLNKKIGVQVNIEKTQNNKVNNNTDFKRSSFSDKISNPKEKGKNHVEKHTNRSKSEDISMKK
ncbi:MAG: hypothetical protein ACI8ZF_001001 [Candidatus Midichloriaceae bacterium]